MKIMKHIFSTLVILHLVSIIGCKKFTDVGLPKSQITRDVIFKDDQLAKSAMAGVYRSLEETGFLSGSQSGAQVVLGAYTDELESYAVATNDASVFYQLTHLATSTKILSMWTTTYTQLYNINSIIEGVDNSNGLSAPVRDKLKGEGLFLRAILHLYLAQTYNAVPYITSTAYDVNQNIGKSSVQEVYTKCRKDLEDAQLLLPQTLAKGNRIYPTRMAAYALLARIAYYQSDWDKALVYANEVLDHPQYQMEPELDKVFLKESSSSIWQLLPYSSIYNPYQGNVFILRAAPPTTIALREDFVTNFEAGDKRATSWVGQIRSAQNQTYYYPFKYKQYSTSTSSLEHSVILRVEELYLIRAEAFINKQQYGLAVDDLNAIRSRANLPLLEGNTDPEDLLNILIKERRSELFTEFGHRYYDLRHYQRLDAVMSVKKAGWKSYYAYWPLPEKELLLNPNLNPQNNGY